MSRSPTLAELFAQLRSSISAELRVSLPARVNSYDATTQTIEAQPLVHDRTVGEDGTATETRLPVIPNVPVIFPSGGGFRLTFPLVAGDMVWLVFGDRSIDAWQAQGTALAPVDGRQHVLSDAVAFPGAHPNSAPWSGADESAVTLGLDSGAADWVALAAKVEAQLEALGAVFDAWTPVANDGGAVLKGLLTTLRQAQSWPGSVASAAVRIKG